MRKDLEDKVKKCKKCQENAPSKLRKEAEVILAGLMDLAPMEFLSIDHFSYGNKNFLLAIDRASGYIFCENVPNKTTLQVTKY